MMAESCHLHATIPLPLQQLFFSNNNFFLATTIFVDKSNNGHPTQQKGMQQEGKTHKLDQSVPTAKNSYQHYQNVHNIWTGKYTNLACRTYSTCIENSISYVKKEAYHRPSTLARWCCVRATLFRVPTKI